MTKINIYVNIVKETGKIIYNVRIFFQYHDLKERRQAYSLENTMRFKKSAITALALTLSLGVTEQVSAQPAVWPETTPTKAFTVLETETPSAFVSSPIDMARIQKQQREQEAEIRKQERKKKLKRDNKTIWSKTLLNIRERPDQNAKIVGQLVEYERAHQLEVLDNGWIRIRHIDTDAYVNGKYVTEKSPSYKEYDVPSERGRGLAKSHMSWRAVTDTSSPQYRLLHSEGMGTGKYGIRTYNGRLCIAMGSYYGSEIGTKFDITLDNGTKLYCVLADQKADKDTNSTNQYHTCDGSVIEFVVETSEMPTKSFSRYREFDSRIASITKVLD